nr:MAG TPA: hypothetical protein [Caudoviricetes sp.]
MEDGITDVAANVREFLDAQTKDNPNLRTNAQIAVGGRDNGCSSKRQGVSGRSDKGQS